MTMHGPHTKRRRLWGLPLDLASDAGDHTAQWGSTMSSVSRRDFIKTAGASAAAASLPAAALARQSQAAPRPNIIVMLVDDMGFSDLGCYGGEIATPNVDSLASEGVRFTQFYNCAKCSPSRTSLMTGQYHQAAGVLSDISSPVACTSLAQVLKDSGYRTCMVGKVHGAGQGGPWDSEFRVLAGAFSFYEPDATVVIDGQRHNPFTPPPGFYTTDAFTDHAIRFIQNGGTEPFFLYMAYNAPHYPLHALPEDIAKYGDRYNEGYDEIRQQRFQRQQQLGIADSSWTFSDRDPSVPAWSALTTEQQTYQKKLMRTYAAMIDRVDQNIGRVMTALQQAGADNNTIIFFMSDNGAVNKDLKTLEYEPGTPQSYYTLGTPWSNAANTPFRKYKKTDHEGGIATPCIAWWGSNIATPGGITRRLSHLIDIMPTCVELAGAQYPSDVSPMQGKSLMSELTGTTPLGHSVLFWQYLGDWRAVRQGHWKALKQANSTQWYLFDFSRDRAETTDVSTANAPKLAELQQLWDSWKANDYCATGLDLPTRSGGDPRHGRRPPLHGHIRQTNHMVEVMVTAPSHSMIEGHSMIELLTFDGRLVERQHGGQPAVYRLERGRFAPGWYVLRVYAGGELYVEEVRMGQCPAPVRL
ncbi:MAG: sulfatase-like hydrolase/transferase [Chitinivibrionales bacterium]|nr:sulfatase-like hydrolase/transferase [Chitinivibrionales bacterium]